MKRILSSFLVISFILWILPLGFFIKPSQEQIACDGQRAMCMCHVMMKHHVPDQAMAAGVSLKAGTSSKENSSGSGSNYFVSAKPIANLNPQRAVHLENQYLFYNNPFLSALEYVPKV